MIDKVLSIAQMQDLDDLCIDTDNASMCWVQQGMNTDLVVNDMRVYNIENKYNVIVPTFTFHDIMEILPQYLTSTSISNKHVGYTYRFQIPSQDNVHFELNYYNQDGSYRLFKGESLLECAFNLLVFCVKHKR